MLRLCFRIDQVSQVMSQLESAVGYAPLSKKPPDLETDSGIGKSTFIAEEKSLVSSFTEVCY